MIILTAGHTGANSGAQCATTYFDEGAENIWLRNRIAEILTNKYGLVVLIDNDTASLQLLTKALNQVGTHGSCVLSVAKPNKSNHVLISSCQNQTSKASTTVDRRPLTVDNIKSTRGLNIKTTHTDTTQTLQITLKPDTIFVPYVHHIRSDTIIAPDPTTKAKLTTARWQIVALILIIIAIIIIFLILRQNDKKT